MTYRQSFLLTTEDPISFEEQSKVKDYKVMENAEQVEKQSVTQSTDLLPPQATACTPTITGACKETERPDLSPLHDLQKEVERLKISIEEQTRKNSVDISFKESLKDIKPIPSSSPLNSFKCRKVFKENKTRIMSFDWSADKRHIICGTDNGTAYVWDGFTDQKEIVVQTPCNGFNCSCSIYAIDKKKSIVSTPKKDVGFHKNFMSNCAFFGSDQQILTTGEDGGVALWDLERDDPVRKFVGHCNVVNGLAINKLNPFSMFSTCGDDRQINLWDVRKGECVSRLNDTHHVTDVQFFPTRDPQLIAYATTDGKAYLFDFKSYRTLQTFERDTILFGASSVDFSSSGRILFVGYDDSSVRGWDTLKGDQISLLLEHDQRISSVQMSPDGLALGTSSWDGQLKVWA